MRERNAQILQEKIECCNLRKYTKELREAEAEEERIVMRIEKREEDRRILGKIAAETMRIKELTREQNIELEHANIII